MDRKVERASEVAQPLLSRRHVFSTAGDAFAAAFPTTDDAAHAALDIQPGLLDAGWPGPLIKVRMGSHTGDAQERDGDYFGPTLD